MTEKAEETRDIGSMTKLLSLASQGDMDARNRFCDLVTAQLRLVAERLTSNPKSPLGSISLVNEVFADLLSREDIWNMPNRRYFFSVAITQMRRVLIDHYRRERPRNGGRFKRIPLDSALDRILVECQDTLNGNILDLEIALKQLEATSPRQHEVILLRFFGGCTVKETAEIMGVAVGTVERDWRLARNKLYLLLVDRNHAEDR